ncbi:molecular chaperone DnaJ [Thalassoglobus polymorphus]|uniref:Chaperone protein DnaJ n=1 Tax=Thalassoglobus polymorphus TaxID=2527994 RepID=A0A517QQG8_9PLAN|nr:molecular chaperone DnaJ [Thalassoglobus polymorphus]QDT33839.1 Chaperone protein DnaJ [Thalassoglobus polymorphus]
MATKRCYYEVLEVSKTASTQEIKKSYKKMALQYHPDRNSDDENATEKFKEAAEAYEVLGDDEKRRRYDQYGHAGVQGARGGAGGFQDVGDIFEAFGDLFEGFGFGGGRRGGARRGGRGSDLKTSLELDLTEAAKGVEKEVEIQRKKPCGRCSGSGAEPGHSPETCDYCGGHGQVVQSQGFFRVQTACPTCRGSGKVVRHKCNNCYGSGREDEHVTRTVTVPAGIETGQHLCLRGEGEAGVQGGASGDLYVEIRVREHPIFHREGSHLLCEIPISYSQAALGAIIEIPLIDGQDTLKIPAGTQPGHLFQIRGQGMPDPRGRPPGDLHVEIQVVVPKKLSEEHRELLMKLADHEEAEVHPNQKNWFERLRDFVTGAEGS